MTDPSAGGGFDFGAAVQVWGDIRDGIRSLNKRWTAKPEAIIGPVVAQASSGSSGDLLFVLGDGPTLGHRWYVREVVIGGASAEAAPAGTAYLLQSASQPPDPAPLYMVRDFTANALPQRSFYGRGEFVIDAQDNLWVFIENPSASTQYTAVVWLEDVEMGLNVWTP